MWLSEYTDKYVWDSQSEYDHLFDFFNFKAKYELS